MDQDRRQILNTGAVLGAASLLPEAVQGHSEDEARIPLLPAMPTPGKAGDFNFLAGEWRIANRRWLPDQARWDLFPGEATCWTILGGVGSVEELRIPAKNFSGMGLRLLDVEKSVWSDHWVNAKSGVVSVPGQTGSFENGAGIFSSSDTDDTGPYVAVGIWDLITPNTCRWRQAVSRDAQASWQIDWVMHWTRA